MVLAYLDEPWLDRCVRALLDSRDVDVEVILVDNGCTNGDLDRLRMLDRVVVVEPGRNLGFAGGCNAGVDKASGDIVALVNSDAVVAADALARLAGVASEAGIGIASASIRLAEDPDRLNSAGNPVHFLGLVWAGGFGQPAAAYPQRRDIACASGAGLAMRRSLWDELGGFAPEYFAYHEDAELSLRCWRRGLRVVYVPDAVVVHRYEFSRNPTKQYLLERNRWILLLTLFQARTLVLIGPPLLALELAMVAVAARQGWLRQKVAGWTWLVRHRRWLLARRRQLRLERSVADRGVARLMSGRFEPANADLPGGAAAVNTLLDSYWRVVRRWL